jgi:predicted molibdopterin-dependent oxidoreductase YjgC
MINSERNLTLMPRAVAAPGESLEDWRIIARIACAMGYAEAFDYPDAEAVYEEIRRFWNPATGYDLRGIGYAELRERPRQWPCAPGQSDDRSPCATATTASASTCCATRKASCRRWPSPRQRQGAFFARPWLPPAELPDDAFPSC